MDVIDYQRIDKVAEVDQVEEAVCRHLVPDGVANVNLQCFWPGYRFLDQITSLSVCLNQVRLSDMMLIKGMLTPPEYIRALVVNPGIWTNCSW